MRNNSVESYVRRGRGGVYLSANDPHGANPLTLVEMAARRFPEYFEQTLRALQRTPLDELMATVDRVPLDRISAPARAFAKAMLGVAYGHLTRIESS